MKFLKYSLIVFFSVVILAEIFLRVTGKYMVYSEMNGKPYYTDYGKVWDTWFHTRPVNDIFTPASPDFHYQYITNQMGFRDKNYPFETNDSTFRILVTGDSYAEGVGTCYDSTWPRLLEKNLRTKNIQAEVIDAGVAGSDIMYDYVFYREKLNAFNPKLILASFNTSDYNDYIMRGGMERFFADGTTHYKRLPWYFFWYKHSRLVRALFHKIGGFNNTGLFISQKEFDQSCTKTSIAFADVFELYYKEALKHKAQFVAVLHTIPGEIISPEKDLYATNIRGISIIAALLKAKGVPCIDLSKPLSAEFGKKDPMVFTYAYDMHFNGTGYNFMAQAIADSLDFSVK